MNTKRDPEWAAREAIIQDAATGKNGWKRSKLLEWGVPWPPPPGWRDTIIRHGFPYDATKNKRLIKRNDRSS